MNGFSQSVSQSVSYWTWGCHPSAPRVPLFTSTQVRALSDIMPPFNTEKMPPFNTHRECSTMVYRLTTPLYIMLIAQLWYCTVTLWLELGVGSKLVCWRGSSNCIDCKISLQYSLRRKGLLQFTSVSVSRNHSSDIILVMNTSSLSKLRDKPFSFLILCYVAFSASSSSWPFLWIVPNPI